MGAIELRSGQLLPIRRVQMPAFASEYDRQGRVKLEGGFTPQLHARVQGLRPALLDAVHAAVVAHPDRFGLHERDLFPCRECLTGEYYLATNETYYVPEHLGTAPTPAVLLKALCLGWCDPWGDREAGGVDDYLGVSLVAELDPEREAFKACSYGHEVIGRGLVRQFPVEPPAAADPVRDGVPHDV